MHDLAFKWNKFFFSKVNDICFCRFNLKQFVTVKYSRVADMVVRSESKTVYNIFCAFVSLWRIWLVVETVWVKTGRNSFSRSECVLRRKRWSFDSIRLREILAYKVNVNVNITRYGQHWEMQNERLWCDKSKSAYEWQSVTSFVFIEQFSCVVQRRYFIFEGKSVWNGAGL